MEGLFLSGISLIDAPHEIQSTTVLCFQNRAHAIIQAAKISKEYEERGGGYKNDKNELGSKKKPSTGAPEPKSESGKAAEVKADGEKPKGEDKPKANSGKKATGPKKSVTKPKAENKLKKPHAEGTRKSTRVGNKRKAPPKDEEDEEEEEEEEKDEGEAEEGQEKIKKRKKAPAKKAKTSKK